MAIELYKQAISIAIAVKTGYYDKSEEATDQIDKDFYKEIHTGIKEYVHSLFEDSHILIVNPNFNILVLIENGDAILCNYEVLMASMPLWIGDMFDRYGLSTISYSGYLEHYKMIADCMGVEVLHFTMLPDNAAEQSYNDFIDETYSHKDEKHKVEIKEVEYTEDNEIFECPLCTETYNVIAKNIKNENKELEKTSIYRCKNCEYAFCEKCLDEILHRNCICPCCRKTEEEGLTIEKLV